MTDATRRAVRTFLQGFLGVLALLAVPILNDIISNVGSGGTVELDPTLWRSVAIAAVAGGVIALISWGQNWLEDAAGVKPLKKPPAE